MALDALMSALVETWCLYAAGSLIIICRIICRWRMIGIHNFKPDDYLIVLAWATYTTMTVAAHLVGSYGDLHAITMEQRRELTPEAAETLIIGTQWFCAGVATYVTFIWILKINMLFFYQRIVNGLWVAKFIKPTMALVVATYFSIMMILFCSCRPYNRMWVVYPDQGEICKPQATINLVPALIMNIMTDLCIMAIPAPVILPVKTTVLRKIGLFILFGAGIFVMTAAILRVVMVLVLGNGKTAAIWSCREDIVAVCVGQAPMLRPMFTKKFWTPGGFSVNSTGFSSTPGGHHKSGSGAYELKEGTIGGSGAKRSYRKRDPYSATAVLATLQEGDSTEKIIGPCGRGSAGSVEGGGGGGVESATPSEMERGEVGGVGEAVTAESGGKWVINVSNQVDVESVEYSSTHETTVQQSSRRYSEFLAPGGGNGHGGWNGGRHGFSGGGAGYAGRA